MAPYLFVICFILGTASLGHGSQGHAATTTLKSLSTSPSQPASEEPFKLSLQGDHIDINNVEVVISGGDCNPNCVLGHQLLTKVTGTSVEAVVTLTREGPYSVALRNGPQEPSSTPQNLSIVAKSARSGKGVPGSGASPTTFNVNTPFCNSRAAYLYDESNQQTPVSSISVDPKLINIRSPITDFDHIVDPGAPIIPPGKVSFSPDGADAGRLLARGFVANPCDGQNAGSAGLAEKTFDLLSVTYYVINVVRWQKSPQASGDQQPFAIESNDWFLFNTKDDSVVKQVPFHGKFSPQLTSALRIYGSDSVGFLAVHLCSEADWNEFKQLQIKYELSFKQRTAINVQHLQALLKILTGPAAAQPAVAPRKIGLYGGGIVKDLGNLPSDITFSATVAFPGQSAAQPKPVNFSQTYQDEGLQRWDISVGVPFTTINEVNFSSTDGVVTGREVARLNAYGFYDIYLHPTDIANPPAFGYPHVMLGLPFSGKVFNKPFVGAGGLVGFQSLPWIGHFLNAAIPLKMNIYGGVVYNKEFRPRTLTIGSPASGGAVSNDLHAVRTWKGQVGIEFSITDVTSKLTKKSDSKSTNSAASIKK
jgi:hypothetical protein